MSSNLSRITASESISVTTSTRSASWVSDCEVRWLTCLESNVLVLTIKLVEKVSPTNTSAPLSLIMVSRSRLLSTDMHTRARTLMRKTVSNFSVSAFVTPNIRSLMGFLANSVRQAATPTSERPGDGPCRYVVELKVRCPKVRAGTPPGARVGVDDRNWVAIR